MVKMVFSDIDGTLLTDDKRVTAGTEQAVKELLGRGIPFVLVSARMPEAITPITERMGIKIPLICYSGALVLTAAGEVLQSVTMEKEKTTAFLREAAARFPQAVVNFYAGHHWYVRDPQEAHVAFERKITGAVPERADFANCLARGVLPHKLLLMMEPADCARAEEELRAHAAGLHVVRSSPTLLEVMEASVTKASGIEVMLRHAGLTAADALSFGDNYNDLEMLRYTGTSVAMGNAPEEVKAAATAVTLSNEEDGIAAYLLQCGLVG